MGVMSLFGEVEVGLEFDERPKIADLEFDKSQRLAFEKEMLGLYVSDHPLLGAEGVAAAPHRRLARRPRRVRGRRRSRSSAASSPACSASGPSRAT